jgi:hypothetical protein
MSVGFTERWAQSTVRQLRRKGVEFAEGMNDDTIDRIGELFDAAVPPELAIFLREAVPIGPSWARWHDGPESVFESARDWVDRAFAFDIEHNDYWHPLLGERPSGLADAIGSATAFLHTAPALIPLYSHRFITTAPVGGPQPVLSVYQAGDSIYYGYDLADYFASEFNIALPTWVTKEPPEVPVWGRLFDLLGTEGTDEAEFPGN